MVHPIPRGARGAKEELMNPAVESTTGTRYYTRFTPALRCVHATRMVTFLGLAATGLPLRFSEAAWSAAFARAIGGFAAILVVHKLCAVTLTIAFLAHVADIAYRAAIKKQWWLLWGPES